MAPSISIPPRLAKEFFEAVREYLRWHLGDPEPRITVDRYLVRISFVCGRVDNFTDALPRGLAANARAMSTSSLIVRWVVRLYAIAVAMTLGYLIFRGIWFKEDTIMNISEIIKIAIIPILTLVIGYYFGSSKAD